MILTSLKAHNNKQLTSTSKLVNNQFSKAINLNRSYRGFQSTPAKRAIVSTAALASANWILAGSSVALPFAQAYKSSRPILRHIRSISAILFAGSLFVLASSLEKNPYIGKLRLMLKDLETEEKDRLLTEYNNSAFYKHIENEKPMLKGRVEDIVAKLKESSPKDNFNSGDIPDWHLLGSYVYFSYRKPGVTAFIYNDKDFPKNLTNSDQMAYLLAQSLSHKILRHETELFSFKSILNSLSLMGILSIGLLTPWGFLSQMSAGLAFFVGNRSILNAYSRELKREADSLAFFLTVRAGYNPKEIENYCGDSSQDEKVSPTSSEEYTLIGELLNSDLVKKLNSNIDYYLFSDELTNSERTTRIREEIANNKELLEFVQINPNYKWESLLKCNYWNSRSQI